MQAMLRCWKAVCSDGRPADDHAKDVRRAEAAFATLVVNRSACGLEVAASKAPASAIAARRCWKTIGIREPAGQLISVNSAMKKAEKRSRQHASARPKERWLIDKGETRTIGQRAGPQEAGDRKPASADQGRRSGGKTPRTTGTSRKKSCRRFWARLAGGRRGDPVGGANEIGGQGKRRDRVEDALNATVAAREEASCRAGGRGGAPRQGKGRRPASINDQSRTSRPASHRVKALEASGFARFGGECRVEGFDRGRKKILGEQVRVTFASTTRTRPYVDMSRQGHHRTPPKGGARRPQDASSVGRASW